MHAHKGQLVLPPGLIPGNETTYHIALLFGTLLVPTMFKESADVAKSLTPN